MVKVILSSESKISMLMVDDKPSLLPDAIEVSQDLYDKYMEIRNQYLSIEDELISLYSETRRNRK
jgi:hypothetical protein